MSYAPEDEVTITYRTLGKASKESYELGEKQGRIDELDYVLDLLAEQQCSHSGCPKCEAYDFISTRIAARQAHLQGTS